MIGSGFVEAWARRPPGSGGTSWEQATLDEARRGGLVPWPYVPVTIVDGDDTLVLLVQSDVVAVGTFEDHVRMPLGTSYAQAVANLTGALLPTPWIEYAIWRSAAVQLDPIAMVPNQYANLNQYLAHSRLIDQELAARAVVPGTLVAGIKKGVVIANFYKKGHVNLFGWYRKHLVGKDGRLSDELAPDVFDDGRPIGSLNRQPIQPKSNVHAADYVDYSHGIRLVGGVCTVNGQRMETASVYTSPTLSRLVNPDAASPPGQRGPLRTPRYPSPVQPAQVTLAAADIIPPFPPAPGPGPSAAGPGGYVPFTPDPTDVALLDLARRRGGGF